MTTIRRWKRTQSAIGVSVALLAGLYSLGAAADDEHDHEHESVKHVLLISFDGLHEQLANAAAALGRVHIKGYDVPGGERVAVRALDKDKAGQIALELLGDPA